MKSLFDRRIISTLPRVFNVFTLPGTYQSHTPLKKMVQTVPTGKIYTTDYKLFFVNEHGHYISPFHDIPLHHNRVDNTFNMVVEIPRWSTAKFEISTKEYLNPIHQDTKSGVPRYVDNVFPYTGYIWNYGALPQTWEDPAYINPDTHCRGDNDPIDVLEIGSRILRSGEVVEVKVLGALCLLDQGETDWKIVTIRTQDEMASKLNDIEDVEKYMPGYLKGSVEWFRYYKIPAGKSENKFGFNGEYKNKEYTIKLIEEVHESWKRLIKSPSNVEEICCKNLTNTDYAFNLTTPAEAKSFVNSQPEFQMAYPEFEHPNGDKWNFIHKKPMD